MVDMKSAVDITNLAVNNMVLEVSWKNKVITSIMKQLPSNNIKQEAISVADMVIREILENLIHSAVNKNEQLIRRAFRHPLAILRNGKW